MNQGVIKMSAADADSDLMRSSRRLLLLAAVLALTSCSTPTADVTSDLDELRTEISSIKESLTTTTVVSPDAETTSSTSTTTTPPPTSTPPDTSPPTVPSTTIPPSPPVTSDGPGFPPEIDELQHGQMVWVVILAASEGFNDPELATAILHAESAGYSTGPTDCDAGATEALGLPDDRFYYTVSVYLSSEADAITALDAFAARGIGGTVAEIQAFCLD